MSLKTAKKTKRIQDSVLAPAESVALGWLVRKLPDWVTPDHLTMLGLVSMCLAGLFYYLRKVAFPGIGIVAGRNEDFSGSFVSVQIGISR